MYELRLTAMFYKPMVAHGLRQLPVLYRIKKDALDWMVSRENCEKKLNLRTLRVCL